MRILFTKQLPLETPGGEASHMFALARNFEALGSEVFMMPVTAHKTPPGLWPAEKIIEVHPFGLHHVLDCFPVSRAVGTFVKSHPVDAVLSWQYETAYLPEFAPHRNFVFGVVAAAPFGLIKEEKANSPLKAWAYSMTFFRTLRKADVIFCASRFARNELVEKLSIEADKIKVVPIGVDEIFQPDPDRRPDDTLKRFVFTGSLVPIKGIYDTLAALAIVKKRGYSNWILKIAGWEDPTPVIQFAREHAVLENIEILGGLTRTELAKEITESQLAILPSHTETFGLAIAEAQACGLPVVSYRTGAIPEMVQDGITGILVDLFDHDQLAEAIVQLINNPESAQNMGKLGQKLVRERYVWHETAKEMLETFKQIRGR